MTRMTEHFVSSNTT